MALTMAIKLDNGVELPQAYFKISKMKFNYVDVSYVEIEVCVFKDIPSYTAGLQEVVKFSYKCSGDTFTMYFSESVLNNLDTNHLSTAYDWLMTLPQYISAEVS